jgi:hypothetical protein
MGMLNGAPSAYIVVAARAFFVPSTTVRSTSLRTAPTSTPLGYTISTLDSIFGISFSARSRGSILSIAYIPSSCSRFLADPGALAAFDRHVFSP